MSRRITAPGKIRVAAILGAMVVAGLVSTVNQPVASATNWKACLSGTTDRQAVFDRAAEISGVPAEVLLGVSFMQSRWDAHGAAPSTSGGYGPMHLTAVPDTRADPDPLGKGEEGHTRTTKPRVRSSTMDEETLRTLDAAAELTGLAPSRLKRDAVANVCAGAALIADYQADAGGATELDDWSAAVARYSGASNRATGLRFARQVFATIRSGESRTTNDGQQVSLAPVPAARVDVAAVDELDLLVADPGATDCPARLGCLSIPAPYEWFGEPEPGKYGNHDLADRPNDLDIDYILVHDTEATWDTTLDLVTTPTYLAWNYSLRSVDGKIAQHLDSSDVGWHAGNWYVNMHSIGIEHEGFAIEGASWYTETLYRNSARLVRHLARKYDVPLDRSHIIGHDQVPGTIPKTVRGMHWDPGPYWDWEHYFKLLGAPIKPGRRGRSDVVTVRPGFERNKQVVTGCEDGTCATQGTNFVYLRTAPSTDAPLVKDIGLHPDGSPSTTHVSDIGARAAAGHKFLVAQRRRHWTGVWYLGEIAWVHNPRRGRGRVLVPSRGKVVVTAGDEAVPVYGRAYPEESAYPEEIPYQEVTPLQYTIKPGQAYVVGDADPETDYYYAKTFNCELLALDCTEVEGEDAYLQIWFGHRIAYVRAADVEVRRGIRPRH
ncbi:MAG: N-acetylmuramoyl-L-alanine amidase [Nocardioides sp.]|nr:N-acetylmuramoyl-L-alanine amidase [Nocardioides sp.]